MSKNGIYALALIGFWSPNFEDRSTPEENRALAEKKRRMRIEEMQEREKELYPDGRPAHRNYI